jgi:hypothetical protein
VDDLGISDEFERHQADGAREVVVRDGVLVAIDGDQRQPRHRSDARERRSDRRRLREVECDATGPPADRIGRRHDGLGVAPGEDDLAPEARVMAHEFEPDGPGPPDDDDRAVLSHGHVPPSEWSRS